ncbi:formin-like protein [Thalictrum thalictroides]|uniref:Formin-like protein n=1 Tax=Thalictrum thalictroides TaxID=46969 RepID=A0A7J6V342_THATH|nr:formin-like protein [Thalictrum thalictroides]
MDPCPFVRILIGNLALKIPVASKPARSGVHPSSSPCFCKIRLKYFPLQTSIVPLIPPETQFPDSTQQIQTLAASFHLSKADLDKLAAKSLFGSKPCLKISIYTGRRGTTCGVNSGRLLGKVSIPLDLNGTELKSSVFHNGWIYVGKDASSGSGVKGTTTTTNTTQMHLNVRAEPDPRFVFQFDGEPECSPQVFQIQGNIRQPVFTCKFSFRNSGDRNNQRSRASQSEVNSSRSWLSSLGSERERPGKERKGWSITVHDLSGSPVAAASMVTPFVASPGSDRVSRSNPGAWLILRPGDGTWKPWGRLEAWRERGSSDGLGYRFELVLETGTSSTGILLAESTLGTHKGGKFMIDGSSTNNNNSNGNSSNHNHSNGNANGTNNGNGRSTPVSCSPGCSPRGSGDYGYGLWPHCLYRGFVMSSTVEGEGKCSKPAVEVSVQHVSCTEDAAAFVALAAAMDLSMDACRLFSSKLRKELCQQQDMFG